MCCDQTCATDWGLFLFPRRRLIRFVGIATAAGFSRFQEHALWRLTALVLRFGGLSPQVCKYLRRYMLAKCWNGTKATSKCDREKASLGVASVAPQFSMLHLRVNRSIINLFDSVLQHLWMFVSATSALAHNSAVNNWCRDYPGSRHVLLPGVMRRGVAGADGETDKSARVEKTSLCI